MATSTKVTVNGQKVEAELGLLRVEATFFPNDSDDSVTMKSESGIVLELAFFGDTIRFVVKDEKGRTFIHRLGWTEWDGSYYGLFATAESSIEERRVDPPCEEWPKASERPL